MRRAQPPTATKPGGWEAGGSPRAQSSASPRRRCQPWACAEGRRSAGRWGARAAARRLRVRRLDGVRARLFGKQASRGCAVHICIYTYI